VVEQMDEDHDGEAHGDQVLGLKKKKEKIKSLRQRYKW
jgi:hypothetical protein